MDYRQRHSGAFVKPPCGAYSSRVGIERHGKRINGRLYGQLMYGKNKGVERK